MSSIKSWFKENRIVEVEAIIPDMSGVARGKILPAEKYYQDKGLRLPEGIFLQTITGDAPDDYYDVISATDGDIVLRPDLDTICLVPWATEPTAQIIHDAYYGDGRVVDIAPRHVLQRVLRPLLRAGRQSMPMGRQWVRGSIQRLDPGRFLARFGLFVCCVARKTSPIAVVMVSASRGRVFAWIFGLYPPVGKHKKIKNIFRLQCRSPAGSLSYYAETSVSHSLRCVPLRRQATTPSRKSPVSSASTV